MNCWEHVKCKDDARKACPAYTNNRGQECWKVTGTKCKGGIVEKASLEEKLGVCRECNFYTDILGRNI